MAYEDGPVGVGGWLVVFLVTLGILSPLFQIGGVAFTLADPSLRTAYGPVFGQLVIAEWALVAVDCLLCWTAVFLLLRVFKPLSVRTTIGILWVLALTATVAEPVAVASVTGIDLALVMSGMGAALIQPFIYSGVWTAYLLRSRRVRNTYYSTEHRPDAAADVFA